MQTRINSLILIPQVKVPIWTAIDVPVWKEVSFSRNNEICQKKSLKGRAYRIKHRLRKQIGKKI